MAIKYERVGVTARIALQWLERNAGNNRTQKGARITRYARDMAAGRWNSDTGETVKFNTFGELIDGQNRLCAVVEADKLTPGIVVDLDVARGLPVEAMQVIDSGASRSLSDVLRISGTPDRNRVASVVRWVANWDLGNFTGGGKLTPTNAELWDVYRKDADAFDAAGARGGDLQRRALGRSRSMGTAFYLLNRLDEVAAQMFFDGYISGANGALTPGSPALALRNRIGRQDIERQSAAEQLALTIKAWNAFRADEKVERLNLPKGDLTSVNFPQPK